MLFFLLKSLFKGNILFREAESKDGLCSPSIWRQGLFYCKTKFSRTEKSDISFEETVSDFFFFSLYTFQEYEERRYEVLCFKAVVDLDD